MAEESGAEKSEEPTARRLSKARDEGQVARSIELPAAAVTVSAVALLLIMGGWLVSRIGQLFTSGFVFDRKTLDTPQLLPSTFFHQVGEGFLLVSPVFLVTTLAAILASGLTGGYLFSWASIRPKASKINPFSGLARIFGTHALVELLKSIAKFTLVAVVLWVLINRHLAELMLMGRMSLEPAMAMAGKMIAESVLWLALCLVLIAVIDAPYQRYAFMKRMKMTKQEIKDEMKDSEGQPEVKQQIRRRQKRNGQLAHDAKGQRGRRGHHQPRALCGGPVLRPDGRWRADFAGQGQRPAGRAHPRRSQSPRGGDFPSRTAGPSAVLHHQARPPGARIFVLCGGPSDCLCVQPGASAAGGGAHGQALSQGTILDAF